MHTLEVHLSDELLAITAAAEPWRYPERPDIAAAFLSDIGDHIFRRSVWLGPMLWESPLPNPSRRLENRARAAARKVQGICVKCGSKDLHRSKPPCAGGTCRDSAGPAASTTAPCRPSARRCTYAQVLAALAVSQFEIPSGAHE